MRTYYINVYQTGSTQTLGFPSEYRIAIPGCIYRLRVRERARCETCGRALNTSDPRSLDCGGVCAGCVYDGIPEDLLPPEAVENTRRLTGVDFSPFDELTAQLPDYNDLARVLEEQRDKQVQRSFLDDEVPIRALPPLYLGG